MTPEWIYVFVTLVALVAFVFVFKLVVDSMRRDRFEQMMKRAERAQRRADRAYDRLDERGDR